MDDLRLRPHVVAGVLDGEVDVPHDADAEAEVELRPVPREGRREKPAGAEKSLSIRETRTAGWIQLNQGWSPTAKRPFSGKR